MPRIPGIRRLFRLDRGARDVDRAVTDELEFHFDMTVRDLVAGGMPEAGARAEATRRFGDVHLARERLEAIDRERAGADRRAEWRDALRHDVRYAVRGLRRSPGFTAAVVVTLGLGIGANAAMFGIVDRLLFRAPAYMREAVRTARVYLVRTFDGKENPGSYFQYRRYLELSAWTTSFDQTAAFTDSRVAVGVGEDAREMRVAIMSASMFSFFDARPAAGRFFTVADDSAPSSAPVAVLGNAFWKVRYGGRDDVLGQRLQVGPTTYTIVGVAPPGFSGMSLEPPAVFVPITWYGQTFSSRDGETMYTTYGWTWMEMIVRRKPAVSEAAATADLSAAYRRSYASQREINPRTTVAEIAKPHAVLGPTLRERGPREGSDAKVATWLAGVTLIVLIIACANVANLLLARAFARRREVAIRLALGVGRGRLVAQLLTESLILAGIGGVIGLVLGQWAGALLRASFLPKAEWSGPLTDGRTLIFALGATVVAGVLAGLAPAIHAGRGDLIESLKAGAREGTYHRSRTRIALLVAQGALSVILLVGAGLFVRSLQHVRQVPLGFDVDPVLWVQPNLRGMTLSRDEKIALFDRLLARAVALPQVAGVSRGLTVPFYNTWDFTLFVAGIDSVSRLGDFTLQQGTPEYFKTVGTRIMAGRGITADDRAGTVPIMVVSEAMAKALWPKANAIGQCVRIEADTMPCHQVVGIAENIHDQGLTGKDDKQLHYYLSSAQWRPDVGGLFVRLRGNAGSEADAMSRALQGDMPGSSYVTSVPLAEIVGRQTRSWELGAKLFVAFGALALVLASIGLYSVVAYNVVQRMHEFGVRVALGAQGRDVVGLMLGQALRLSATGVVLGAAVALWAGRFIKPLLFDESPADPVVFATVAASLLAVAIVASLIPALRATRADPVRALRSD
jgi:putative ABC transport system permease protein